MKVISFDPSMSNWGYVYGDLDPNTDKFTPVYCGIISTKRDQTKSVANNSKDLTRVQGIVIELVEVLELANPELMFAEVPHGSQSSRASVSYGVCIALLASLRHAGYPLIEVTAENVKHVVASANPKRTPGKVSKKEVITWATQLYPELDYPRHRGALAGKTEHIADAIAALHAGVQTGEYARIKPFLMRKSEQ